jgi:DNA-binding transcriptional regulator YhcF (GntR family)
MKLYQQLAHDLSDLIRTGALQPGDRIPSVRQTCRERGLSPATGGSLEPWGDAS